MKIEIIKDGIVNEVDKKLEALNYIIANKEIKTVFQPIISLNNGSVLGHEALSRITHESEIGNPEMLFKVAGEYNKLWELERLCRTKSLESAYEFMIPPYSKKLFLNVNPSIMHDESFKEGWTQEFLQKYRIVPNNIIFEITERNVITDMAGFRSTIEHYKRQNYRIAIDDAGAGYSGLNLISDVNPNYIKLDMNLIRGIDKDNLKYALVRGMVELSKVSSIYLIAEGIETYEELTTLINLGVQYGQGYYIQKPQSEILEIREELVESIKELTFMKNIISQSDNNERTIKKLVTVTKTVTSNEMVIDLYDYFNENQESFGVCVLEDNKPVGIITREKLNLKLSGRYGFTLYQNKTVCHIMDRDFLKVDSNTPISMVSSLAMARTNDKLYDFIVIAEGNSYLGTVTIKDLLLKSFEIKIHMAKHQSPLTELPGNLIIEQKLNSLINSDCKYTIAYLDIDNFKPFNDIYGFENGDLIIRLLADIMRENMPDNQFLGHIGGDDFVIIIDEHVGEDYFNKIKVDFERTVLNYYNTVDKENGFVETSNRQGDLQRFPLITVTIVTVDNKTFKFDDIYELTKTLAKLKNKKKQSPSPNQGRLL